jgi:hypothetical protein
MSEVLEERAESIRMIRDSAGAVAAGIASAYVGCALSRLVLTSAFLPRWVNSAGLGLR